MALTRRFLSTLGIESDKLEEIITAHTETVEGLKKERDKYKAQVDELEDVKAQLDESNKELEKLKDSATKDGSYKEKYDNLDKEFKEYKQSIEDAKAKTAKTDAYKALLKEIGIADKRIDQITKLADLDKIKFDKDGKIEGADDLKKNLSEEWSEFVQVKGTRGASTATPPKGTGDDGVDTSAAKDRVAKFMAERYGTVKEEGK